jgi:Undecaprenyl-phosphate glucose phosphotransferase
MSTEIEIIERFQAQRRRRAPLSQGVVAGLVALGDGLAIVIPGLLIHVLYGSGADDDLPGRVGIVTLAAGILVLLFHAAGLYRFPAVMSPKASAARIVGICMIAALALLALAFGLKISSHYSRFWAGSWLLTATLAVLALRLLIADSMKRLAKSGMIGRRIVVYGGGLQGERLLRRIEELDEPWNRVVGVFDDRISRVGPVVGRYPVLGNLQDLVVWGRQHPPDEILVALPWGAENRILEILQIVAVLPSNVRLSAEFHRLDMIQGRTNYQFGVPMLNAFEKPVEGWGRIWKRLFDLVATSIVTFLLLPVIALAALCVRIESPGPILFRQPRYGFNNRLIEVFKFRTMRQHSADKLGTRLTERDDPRVTRVGKVLRRLSIDELPQLLNVFKGEMSLVGPRPHAIRTTAGGRQCDEVVDQYAIRHKVKPGITGWAQVNGLRGTMETEEHLVKRLEHDLYYINNWTPLLDLKILAMTVWVVLSGRNSY